MVIPALVAEVGIPIVTSVGSSIIGGKGSRHAAAAQERYQQQQYELELERIRRQNVYNKLSYDYTQANYDAQFEFSMAQFEATKQLLYKSAEQAEYMGDLQAAEIMRSARENYKIYAYDASVATAGAYESRIAENRSLILNRNKLADVLAAQNVLYAQAGVALDEGTPVEVADQTAWAATREAINIFHIGNTEFNKQLSVAHTYKLLANKSLSDGKAGAYLVRQKYGLEAELARFQADHLVEPVRQEATPPVYTPVPNNSGYGYSGSNNNHYGYYSPVGGGGET